MKTITITIPEGKKAEWINNILTLVDEKPKDITDRIKTFDDALKELDRGHPLVEEYTTLTEDITLSPDLLAYLKLRIVCAALNEGWEPQFTKDEVLWYPWHWLYTQKEIDGLDEEEKTNLYMIPTDHHQTEYTIFACSISGFAAGGSDACIGFRLCLKSEELADYCGKQFIHLWADFKLIRKCAHHTSWK